MVSHVQTPSRNPFVVISLVLLALIVFMLFVSQIFGAATATTADLWAFISQGEAVSSGERIIQNIRLPRALIGIVVGIHFGIAGLILQVVLRNPLAEPGVLGISAGASLAVVISILAANMILGETGLRQIREFPPSMVPFFALIGGLVAAVLIVWISWDKGINPRRTTVGGVVIGMIINALVLAVIVGFGAGRAEMAILWISGSLFSRGYDNLLPVLWWSGAALIALPFLVRPLSILRFGDDFARSVGLNVQKWRLIAAFVAVSLAASAVAVSGPIGFVGLIVPHFARLLVGGNISHQLVISGLAGALLTMSTDLFGRVVLPPLEVPAGAITALVGVPIFLFLLQKNMWKLK